MTELKRYEQVKKDAKYIQEKIKKQPPRYETKIVHRPQPKMVQLNKYIQNYQVESNPVKRKMYLDKSQKIIEELKYKYSLKYRIKKKLYNLLFNFN